LSAASVHAEDWPSWRGPRGDGTWQAPKLPEQWPQKGLKPVWRQPIGGGYAGPAVVGSRLFILDREKAAGGGKDDEPDGFERVLCFDARSGERLWFHQYPTRYGDLGGYSNGPRAMPTVHDGRVYTLGAVGHLHCFEAVTGKVLWAKDMVAEHKARIPEWGFAASPVIDGSRVIVHTGAEPNGCLIAFDRLTGKEVWRSLSDPAGYCTPILITSKSGRQLVAWTPENIHGLNPETGKRLWSIPYKVTYGVSIATPIFQQDTVFVTGYWEGAKALRLGSRPADAELIWEDSRQLRGLMAQPLYRDGYLYSLDKGLGLVCFELATGKKHWDDHRLTARGRNPHASMIWLNDGNRVLILNAAGELILARLSPQGFQEQSRTKVIDGQVWSHPAFAGRFIYVRSDGAEGAPRGGKFELVCVPLVE
jgi:outer membrane protein assembly factor BamB